MIQIDQLKFATSVRLGAMEHMYIKAGHGITITWDPEQLRYVLTDSKDTAKHLPMVWVHPTNVQYAVPLMVKPEEKKKSASK